MTGIRAWLNAQAHIISAIITNRPAPARQVLVCTLVLIALAYLVPKIVKLVSK